MSRHRPEETFSPFPLQSAPARIYTTASETLGFPISGAQRVRLWNQITNTQALCILAQILVDMDVSPNFEDMKQVDRRWVASLTEESLRTKLLVASSLGATVFAPQLLLLAATEALSHCPDGPAANSEADLQHSLQVIVKCILGVADDSSSWSSGESWGGLDVGLAGEVIANFHFNRFPSMAHQLSWTDQTWFQDWPESNAETGAVGGQPRELFKEATGVELDDFAAIAFNLYVQADLRQTTLFPSEFFASLGLPEKAISHFLNATTQTLPGLKAKVQREIAGSSGSRFAFNTLRRFPLLRLASGQILLISPTFLMQRALSEVTYFDVRDHLKQLDRINGTRRDEAFHLCTTKVLEHATGETLRRMFSGAKGRVIDERHLQQTFGNRRSVPSTCDFAVQTKKGWILIEVTDRSLPVPVVFANADRAALDEELERVLTRRKAKQLASTMALLKESEASRRRNPEAAPAYIPLVITSSTALPWNAAVHHRTKELLSTVPGLTEDFCRDVALITLKDLRYLENASARGHDVFELLRSWRDSDPGNGLDQFLFDRGVPLGPPKWEQLKTKSVIARFAGRMRGDHNSPSSKIGA